MTRCPKCGSTKLVAKYDSSKDPARAFLRGGAIGFLINRFRNHNASLTYWECMECGCAFPMDVNS